MQWCSAVQCGVEQCSGVVCTCSAVVWRHGAVQVWCRAVPAVMWYIQWCGAVRCSAVHGCCTVWCGVVWCGVVWCGVVWCMGAVVHTVVLYGGAVQGCCAGVLYGVVLCRGAVQCDVVHAVEECGGAVQWCGVV
jgi:hypothetical protein